MVIAIAAYIIFAEHSPEGVRQAKREEQPAEKFGFCAAAFFLFRLSDIAAFCADVIAHMLSMPYLLLYYIKKFALPASIWIFYFICGISAPK